MKKIRVLIVDDSALVRESLKEIINSFDIAEVIDTISNPINALKKLEILTPDVIITDIEMPEMNGLEFIEKALKIRKTPFIVCSSYVDKFSDNYFKALKLGAVEIISKPKISTKSFYEESKIQIYDAIKAASIAKTTNSNFKYDILPKLAADVIIDKPTYHEKVINTDKIIVIGSSTGGTEALEFIFSHLSPNVPGIVVTQHMPENFTKSFANRLNNISKLEIKEAENDDLVTRGKVFIAKGNYHLMIKRNFNKYYLQIKDGPLVSRHRPSVDVLFRSAARSAAQNSIGIILTGMGDDGAQGLLEMKNSGAFTIAQDESSCVVFGMPKEAIKLGAVIKVFNLNEIIHYINSLS
jgi:two-component system chemotaxis response regulator CheB